MLKKEIRLNWHGKGEGIIYEKISYIFFFFSVHINLGLNSFLSNFLVLCIFKKKCFFLIIYIMYYRLLSFLVILGIKRSHIHSFLVDNIAGLLWNIFLKNRSIKILNKKIFNMKTHLQLFYFITSLLMW